MKAQNSSFKAKTLSPEFQPFLRESQRFCARRLNSDYFKRIQTIQNVLPGDFSADSLYGSFEKMMHYREMEYLTQKEPCAVCAGPLLLRVMKSVRTVTDDFRL